MAHPKMVHHVAIHPNYGEDGDMQGYEVHAHHIEGGKVRKTRHDELGSAVKKAHEVLAGHEECYEAENHEEAESKNGEEPDEGAGIAGVPRRAQPPVRSY